MEMRYELMQRGDLTITFGDIEDTGLVERVPFYISRESGDAFAEGALPGCGIAKSYGFSEVELHDLERVMRNNMPIVYDRLRKTGAWSE